MTFESACEILEEMVARMDSPELISEDDIEECADFLITRGSTEELARFKLEEMGAINRESAADNPAC